MRKLFNFLFSFLLLLLVSTLNAQLVFEYEGTRNLSSSPITIDVQGDKFDYHFFAFCDSASTTFGNLEITLNSDTGTNYSRYFMRGDVSTASSSTATSQSNIALDFTRNQSSRNSLAMGSLTGSSGDNRKVSTLNSTGYNPRVYVSDYYWTNTVDEATTLTFTGSVSASYKWHIIVYRTGKITSQSSWQIVDTLSWSSESTEKSFTGLDGDLHKQYMVSWEGDQTLQIELNNDNGANYNDQTLKNSSGTISATNITENYIIAKTRSNVIINAESGVDRLIYGSSSHTSSSQQNRRAVWWQESVSNLVSIDCSPVSSATGTATLYRRKNPHATADRLPFQTLKTFTVSGDYSSGDVLSGLSLDQYKLVKIEWLGHNSTTTTTTIGLRFNSDTGSNYDRQYLRGRGSTASAASSTVAQMSIGGVDDGEQGYGVIYIYPKSGEYRPTLATTMGPNNSFEEIFFWGQWWLNSANEINSITTFSTTTDVLDGQIRISVLK